jgi:DNA modification methylase
MKETSMAEAAAALRDSAATWMEMERLTAWSRNPRVNDHVVPDVAASIVRFGWGNPILAREENLEVIAGHTRLKAAGRLKGLWDAATPEERAKWSPDAQRVATRGYVPVRLMSLDEANAHLHALADNRLAEKADWDVPELYDVLVDFNPDEVELAGWSAEEYEELRKEVLRSGGAGDDEGAVEDEDVDVTLPDEPITQPGDLWLLGKHRLVCGDSTKLETWDRLMGGGERFDLVFTDPPYGVDYVGKTAEQLEVYNDDAKGLPQLLAGAFDNVLQRCRAGAVWYVCAPPGRPLNLFLEAMLERNLWRHTLAWIKDAFVFGRSDFHYQFEAILYGWTEGVHRPPPDRKQSNVWQFDRPKRSEQHPTMKPIKLVAHALAMSSDEGELVGDPFGGSGTTLVACEQLGRRCRTIELSPAYCDVIVRRWEEASGQKAVREPA